MYSGQSSPVLADQAPAPMKERVGIHSNRKPYSQSGGSFSTGLYIPIPRRKNNNILEDVLSNGWLEAMKSSSPPRKKQLKDFNVGVASDDCDHGYSSWMVTFFSLVVKHVILCRGEMSLLTLF